ncbi:MAG: addiction module protein [Reyranellaceae bacterium]
MSLRTADLPEDLKQAIAKLSPEARLTLADALWDDLEAEFQIAPPELSPEHRAILEARNAEFEANPHAPRKSLDEILAKHGLKR